MFSSLSSSMEATARKVEKNPTIVLSKVELLSQVSLHTVLPDILAVKFPERHPKETSGGKTEPDEVQTLV